MEGRCFAKVTVRTPRQGNHLTNHNLSPDLGNTYSYLQLPSHWPCYRECYPILASLPSLYLIGALQPLINLYWIPNFVNALGSKDSLFFYSFH